jgi:hypothetical protein
MLLSLAGVAVFSSSAQAMSDAALSRKMELEKEAAAASTARADADGLPPCPGEEGKTLAKNLRQAHASRDATVLTSVFSRGDTVRKRRRRAIENARGDVTKSISDKIKDYSALFWASGWLEGFFIEMINLSICLFLRKPVSCLLTRSTAFLNMICIPLPS